MKYCNLCLETNTRPNAKFNEKGICIACENVEKETNEYDENERKIVLNNLIDKYCSKKSNIFDCIIGVSGGKDSTRQAIWVRDKLKLNPLLVCCAYPPEQLTLDGAKNLSNLINLGFNLIITGPAPATWKKLLKESFFKGNYLLAPELALYSSLPQIAIKFNIKLIFWGENPGLIWNDKETLKKDLYDGNDLRNSNTLKNCNIDWMDDLVENEYKKIPYRYPSPLEFKKNNIQIIFLSWFWNNWSMTNNAIQSITYGLISRKKGYVKIGDLFGYTAIDDSWVSINQMIKYYKFGFGRATDYLNFEIRDGNILRKDAIKIAKKYDGLCHPKIIKKFCNYLEISEKKFWEEIDKKVNTKLFSISNKKSHNYIPKFIVGKGI